MSTNDDFVALFARNLTLQPRPEPVPQPQQQEAEPIIYSITQHYNHSNHASFQPETNSEPSRPSSEPPQTPLSAEQILTRHGINYTALSAPQLDLFRTATDAQQLRLIQLWQICPPSSAQANPASSWSNTTLLQEEMFAQLRYERHLAEAEQKQNGMSLDDIPLTPVQTDDGSWTSCVEPYMESGYEALARREYEESGKQQNDGTIPRSGEMYSHFGSAVGGQEFRPAMDPVYNNNGWTQQQQAMENQYGAYQEVTMEL